MWVKENDPGEDKAVSVELVFTKDIMGGFLPHPGREADRTDGACSYQGLLADPIRLGFLFSDPC